MTESKLLPCKYHDAELMSEFSWAMFDGVWLEDWGPFKQGETFDCLEIDDGDCEVRLIGKSGRPLKTVPVKIVPVEPTIKEEIGGFATVERG